jgi:hypothetical protein
MGVCHNRHLHLGCTQDMPMCEAKQKCEGVSTRRFNQTQNQRLNVSAMGGPRLVLGEAEEMFAGQHCGPAA